MVDAAARPTQAVILAGGRGERMRPLTDTRPKPMLEFHGKPFLEYMVEMLRDNGFERVTILVGYLAEVIVDHFGDGSRLGVQIDYSHTPPEALTSRRMQAAAGQLDERFLLLYCDNYWPMRWDEMWAQYLQRGLSRPGDRLRQPARLLAEQRHRDGRQGGRVRPWPHDARSPGSRDQLRHPRARRGHASPAGARGAVRAGGLPGARRARSARRVLDGAPVLQRRLARATAGHGGVLRPAADRDHRSRRNAERAAAACRVRSPTRGLRLAARGARGASAPRRCRLSRDRGLEPGRDQPGCADDDGSRGDPCADAVRGRGGRRSDRRDLRLPPRLGRGLRLQEAAARACCCRRSASTIST